MDKKQMDFEKNLLEKELGQLMERTLGWENELTEVLTYERR